MTILVTGGAGYVGSICCRQLIDQGHNVIVLDDLSAGHMEAIPKEATLFQVDYGDRARVGSLLRQFTFDAVFHFAAKALIAQSVTNPGVFFAETLPPELRFWKLCAEAHCGGLCFHRQPRFTGIRILFPYSRTTRPDQSTLTGKLS